MRCRSKDATEVSDQIGKAWIRVLGPPQVLLSDGGHDFPQGDGGVARALGRATRDVGRERPMAERPLRGTEAALGSCFSAVVAASTSCVHGTSTLVCSGTLGGTVRPKHRQSLKANFPERAPWASTRSIPRLLLLCFRRWDWADLDQTSPSLSKFGLFCKSPSNLAKCDRNLANAEQLSTKLARS